MQLNRTIFKLANLFSDEDTVESFVDKFEAFLKGMFRFFQLYDPWATEGQSMISTCNCISRHFEICFQSVLFMS